MLRAVLDTNVIVSSIISKKGALFQLRQAWMDFRFSLITSASIIEEVRRVLLKPDVKDTFHLTDDMISNVADTMMQNAIIVPGDADVRGAIPEDPSDEKILAAALKGVAHVNVSGDKHLLALGKYQNIPILIPRQFLDQLGR
jgi:putative PIN family toxin of toxin-antitoxin system